MNHSKGYTISENKDNSWEFENEQEPKIPSQEER